MYKNRDDHDGHTGSAAPLGADTTPPSRSMKRRPWTADRRRRCCAVWVRRPADRAGVGVLIGGHDDSTRRRLGKVFRQLIAS